MNKEYYDKLKSVPKDAQKKIVAGRIKGATDIKPQWRMEIMTEVFGACGVGWKYEILNQRTIDGSDNQIFAFVDINLFVKIDDKWSEPIPGIGGNMLVAKEKYGMYCNDEAFKMALTDALSVAMKAIGVAADIYRGICDTKYSSEPADSRKPKPSETKKPSSVEIRPTFMTKETYDKIKGLIFSGETKRAINGIDLYTTDTHKMSKIFRDKLSQKLQEYDKWSKENPDKKDMPTV